MAIGFTGNSDLYGIGIRIGYYTAALSLPIGTIWAPSEIFFLHPITLTFLVALLIGVSVYSMDPSTIYAIEPFMCMQVAYYTFFMNFWTPKLPRYLAWEDDYFKVFSSLAVGLCLIGYDTWYWWIGMNKMKRTPGEPTFGLFIYWGREDLFQWISYPVRAFLPIVALLLLFAVFTTFAFRSFERTMNALITPSRLGTLSEKWASDLEMFEPTSNESLAPAHLSPPKPSRRPSKASTRTASTTGRPASRTMARDPGGTASGRSSPAPAGDWKDGAGEKDETSKQESQEPRGASMPEKPTGASNQAEANEPELRLRKTVTGLLKRHVLGWKSEEATPVEGPAEYAPKLEDLLAAETLLKSLNKIRSPWWRCHYDYLVFSVKLVFALASRGVRLRFLVAVAVYVHTLWSPALWVPQLESWPQVIFYAVRHPAYHSMSPEDVGLASRILLTVKKRSKFNVKNYVGPFIFWFSILSLLVIGTELAIQWNSISGVQNLRSVGQLIPASIGVGGLAKVVWSALFEKEEELHLCFGKCHGDHRRREWREACEVFERAEAAYERRMSPACVLALEEV